MWRNYVLHIPVSVQCYKGLLIWALVQGGVAFVWYHQPEEEHREQLYFLIVPYLQQLYSYTVVYDVADVHLLRNVGATLGRYYTGTVRAAFAYSFRFLMLMFESKDNTKKVTGNTVYLLPRVALTVIFGLHSALFPVNNKVLLYRTSVAGVLNTFNVFYKLTK